MVYGIRIINTDQKLTDNGLSALKSAIEAFRKMSITRVTSDQNYGEISTHRYYMKIPWHARTLHGHFKLYNLIFGAIIKPYDGIVWAWT